MANNPLFSSTNRRRSFSYNPQGQGSSECHGSGVASNGEQNANEPPPAKRSRTSVGMGDGNNEDVWDDDMEFTQAELEDIEIMASQAITGTKPDDKVDNLGTSRVSESKDEKTFAKPRNLSLSRTGRANSSSSSSLSSGGSFNSAVSGSLHYGSSSTSSSSSLQPKSLSSNSTRNSKSISSGRFYH